MHEDDKFAAMVDACITVHASVTETGTAEMMLLTRALLFLVGKEAARQASACDANKNISEPSTIIRLIEKPYWE